MVNKLIEWILLLGMGLGTVTGAIGCDKLARGLDAFLEDETETRETDRVVDRSSSQSIINQQETVQEVKDYEVARSQGLLREGELYVTDGGFTMEVKKYNKTIQQWDSEKQNYVFAAGDPAGFFGLYLKSGSIPTRSTPEWKEIYELIVSLYPEGIGISESNSTTLINIIEERGYGVEDNFYLKKFTIRSGDLSIKGYLTGYIEGGTIFLSDISHPNYSDEEVLMAYALKSLQQNSSRKDFEKVKVSRSTRNLLENFARRESGNSEKQIPSSNSQEPQEYYGKNGLYSQRVWVQCGSLKWKVLSSELKYFEDWVVDQSGNGGDHLAPFLVLNVEVTGTSDKIYIANFSHIVLSNWRSSEQPTETYDYRLNPSKDPCNTSTFQADVDRIYRELNETNQKDFEVSSAIRVRKKVPIRLISYWSGDRTGASLYQNRGEYRVLLPCEIFYPTNEGYSGTNEKFCGIVDAVYISAGNLEENAKYWK